ncbi:hypothetical protein LCGC14_1595080 [marine sediment metagenome]|uniref:LamG-like jellyroll fold domain-containing protein n=1 Tax=marine sediment metagenome TaxID=412755 RepID=A0A0F9IZ59_9ZZZZ
MTLVQSQMWWPGINRQHPLARGLGRYWPMWEGAGSQVGDLVNPNPEAFRGTLINEPTWVGSENVWALGYLAASTQYVDFGLFNDAETGPFTVTAQANVSAASDTNAGLYSNNTGANFKGPFLLQGNNAWPTIAWLSGDQIVSTTTSSGWHEYTMVRYAGTTGIEGFVDGTSVGTAAGRSGIVTGQNLYLGVRFRNDSYLTGQIGRFSFWNRALAPSEIAHLARDPHALTRLRSRPHVVPAAAAVGNPWYYYQQQTAAG